MESTIRPVILIFDPTGCWAHRKKGQNRIRRGTPVILIIHTYKWKCKLVYRVDGIRVKYSFYSILLTVRGVMDLDDCFYHRMIFFVSLIRTWPAVTARIRIIRKQACSFQFRSVFFATQDEAVPAPRIPAEKFPKAPVKLRLFDRKPIFSII